MKKIGKMNELSWLLGNLLCALGVALCTKANFGLSMIAAPPYIFNQYIVKFLPWFSQGTAEYFFQAVLLIVFCLILGRFRLKFLLSFATAVIFGKFIDLWLFIFGGQAAFSAFYMRVIAFVLGELITALAIAFYFRTSLPLCLYELIVVKLAEKFDKPNNTVKYILDFTLLGVAIISTLLLFGGFVGVGVGTIIITVVNAPLINMFGKLLDKLFTFQPAFPKLVKALEQ